MTRLPIRRRFRPKSNGFRLACQRLEDRLAPATFTVTTLADIVPGSLRVAINSANATTTADDINFSVAGTITLTGGELSITQPLSIVGPGILVSGNNASRVFNTTLAAAGTKISFTNLFITNGKGLGGGGIIADDQALTLTACTVTGNKSTGAGGGILISAAPGSLTLQSSVFTGNHADNSGGGIWVGPGVNFTNVGGTFAGNTTDVSGGAIYMGNGATATITSCVIAANAADDRGGAILCNKSSLTVTNSTLSGNGAATDGGGIFFDGAIGAGGFTVRNSTLSGNTAISVGGGIALLNCTGTLTVQNSTITANTAGAPSSGGGIGQFGGAANIFLESSIVSGNIDSGGTFEDLYSGGQVTAKFCAIGTKAGVLTFSSDPVTTSLLGANFKFGPLANNGGSGGQTHVPAPDSPLINKGSNPASLTTDQRGGAAARNSNGGVDIGSVELQVFLVTNTNNNNTGSLRTALTNANTFGGEDTVAFDPTLFASAKTITLASEIAINDGVQIIGPSGKLTINGGANIRVFNTSGAPANTTITMQDLTLTGCSTTQSGGAIFVDDETLFLIDCTITGNTAGAGGGIYINGTAGSLNMTRGSVSNNATTGPDAEGGGIFLYSGSATIRDTTISGNTATGGGGGIVVYNGGSLLVENSTVSGNRTTSEQGGGLYFFGTVAAGGLIVRNSTFSGNTASTTGGGIGLSSFTGNLTVQNCTITSNTASGANGGGIARVTGTGTVSLSSTIVAGNSNASTPDLSFNAATNVGGNDNLIGAANVGNFTLTGTGNQTGTKASPLNAKLDSLASNGGPTKTHFPKPGSPVIDKGNNAIGLANDQRGPGFARVSDVADVGAVERLSTRVTNVLDSGSGSLRQAILNANANPNTFLTSETISFDPTVFATAQKITLTSGQIVVDDWLTVGGPSAQLTIDGNGGGRIFFVIAIGANVLLQRLALTNGKVSGDGGAIAIGISDLTLEDCSITNCSASGIGGAIHSQGFSTSILTIRRSTLSANTAAGGGAIAAGNDLSILDSTLSGNVATSNGGGALLLYRGSNITNSTLSGNSALAGAGGGLCLFDDSAHGAIRNCTITGNSAANNGGGIAQIGTYDDLTLSSTIVTGNFNSNSPDISFDYPAAVIGNNNLIGAADVGNFTLSGTGNQTGTLVSPLNAKLGPLATNGGPTKTHAPLPGSPAFDKGNDDAALVNDQRGVSFPRMIGGLTDVGAVESPSFVVSNNNNSGGGSLRQAVITANANPGPDTITFDPAFFATPKTITLTGRIDINEDVTISGPGAAHATVFGNKFDRVFDTGKAKTGAAIAIFGLTVSGGFHTDGGGIFVGDESVTMTQCTITGNTATRQGGGVFVDSNGALTLVDCSITSNVANDSFGVQSSSGGGIYVLLGGSLTILNSTIAFNSAGTPTKGGSGGGVGFVSVNGSVTIRNCTIVGNSALQSGGGIAFLSSNGQLTVQNSTITSNSCTSGSGGGIASSGKTTVVQSAIVSGNDAGQPGDDINATGHVITLENSAVGDSIGFTFTGSNNLSFGLNLNLGPLANNGGPTLTRALLSGSPAINAGNNLASLTTDQRGAGFARVNAGGIDIGAFESKLPPTVRRVVINGGAAQRSRVTTVTLDFDSVVSFSGSPVSAFTLKRQADNAEPVLSAAVNNGAVTSVTLTFLAGPAVDSDSLADGRYTLTVDQSKVSANGAQLDGNIDGVGGDNYVLGNTTAPTAPVNIFRLFGDSDGDGTVANNDFNLFRSAFGGTADMFDFDGDGSVSGSDFNKFRVQFGSSI